MRLVDLKEGQEALVVRIDADEDLKRRFASLGLRRGSQIVIKAFSLNKSTIEIKIGSTLLALRKEEADKIQVKVMEKI